MVGLIGFWSYLVFIKCLLGCCDIHINVFIFQFAKMKGNQESLSAFEAPQESKFMKKVRESPFMPIGEMIQNFAFTFTFRNEIQPPELIHLKRKNKKKREK